MSPVSLEDQRLPRDFFARPSLEVAPELLGRHLSFGGVTLRLTELEAYAGELDPGSHAFRGVTPRTAPMFGPPGFTYVYFTYGHHWCVNLVVGEVGSASAVLVRAGEVLEGEDLVRARRGPVRERDWARGPGRLGQALAMSKAHTGLDFCRPLVGDPIDLVVSAGDPVAPEQVVVGPRVGVSGPGGDAAAYPWRFSVAGDPTVSAYRPGVVRRRR
ncbi:DNA-3-methyladenine glycosylase [Terrabacter sp. MAHUQ-38]|nr:DNA-3-methyladenine glycosylase [Terrabacter sp. MAHUQ-38]MBC9823189.1 DNA-3-methyladenine glycosylase [Terrabacter sp. MAHUQ-38]